MMGPVIRRTILQEFSSEYITEMESADSAQQFSGSSVFIIKSTIKQTKTGCTLLEKLTWSAACM
jgi:hypothetical protein